MSCIAPTSRASTVSGVGRGRVGKTIFTPTAMSPSRSSVAPPSEIPAPFKSHAGALMIFTAPLPVIAPIFTRPSPTFVTATVSTLVTSVPVSAMLEIGPCVSVSGSSIATTTEPGKPFATGRARDSRRRKRRSEGASRRRRRDIVSSKSSVMKVELIVRGEAGRRSISASANRLCGIVSRKKSRNLARRIRQEPA